MKGRRKNSKPALNDFIRYRGKSMSGRERNAFEKELQKDPFAEEAGEGFTLLTEEMIAEDIRLLDKRLNIRTVKNKRMSYYRIAASVAVLMVISSVYIVLDRNRPSKFSENIDVSDTIEIRETEALKQEKTEKPISAIPSEAQKKPEKRPATDVHERSERSLSDEMSVKGEVINKEDLAAEAKKDNETIPAGKFALPVAPEKNDSFLAAATEKRAVVRSVSIDKKSVENYQPPQPVTGKDSFDIYIQKNIRKPESHQVGQTSVVRLNLSISRNGVIENIKVLESPGNEYSSEAIRLIKEGPAWKPAVREGQAVEENTRLDIVFR